MSLQPNSSIGRYLIFSLGNENFAIPLSVVKEVTALKETTKVPNTPDYFLGIMNLRGKIISVIDFGKKIKISNSLPKNSESAIIILDLPKINLGILTNSVNRVLSYAQNNIQIGPMGESNYKTDFVTGVLQDGNKFILLLDITKAFKANEIRLPETQNQPEATEQL